MFTHRDHSGWLESAGTILWLIYHTTVRSVRSTHGNAVIALLMSILQMVMLVAVFYVMLNLLGLRSMAIRGDFLLYIMSGIFLFFAHIKAISAIMGSEGPTSPMMQHLPMNTAIAIASAALASLYIQVLAMLTILAVYHLWMGPIEIIDPVRAFGMFLASWFSGVTIGLVFLAIKPWAPGLVQMVSRIYIRVNMFASGKMFLANTLPSTMVAMFDWNPLFHTIDQARGYTFINYNPHYSSPDYPLYVALVFLVLGLMGEFYTRRFASQSWGARR